MDCLDRRLFQFSIQMRGNWVVQNASDLCTTLSTAHERMTVWANDHLMSVTLYMIETQGIGQNFPVVIRPIILYPTRTPHKIGPHYIETPTMLVPW